MSNSRPCSGCGMKIEFIKNSAGQFVPAQRVRAVMVVRDGRLMALEVVGAYVSHYETCPDANKFSRQRHAKGERDRLSQQSEAVNVQAERVESGQPALPLGAAERRTEAMRALRNAEQRGYPEEELARLRRAVEEVER